MNDDDFRRLLHKQLEEQKRDQGLTTIRSIERKKREQQQRQSPKKPKKSN